MFKSKETKISNSLNPQEKKFKNIFTFLYITLLVVSIASTLWFFSDNLNSIENFVSNEYKSLYIEEEKTLIKSFTDNLIERINLNYKQFLNNQEKEVRFVNQYPKIVNQLLQRGFKTQEIFSFITIEDKNVVILKNNHILSAYNENIAKEILRQFGHINSKEKFVLFKVGNRKIIFSWTYCKLLNVYFIKYKDLSKAERNFKKQMVEKISSIRFGSNKSFYFFVLGVEKKGNKIQVIRLANPNMPRNIWGKPIPLTKKDIHSKPFIKDILNIALTKGQGFEEYYFRIPGTNKIARKISYIRYCHRWHWILGTGFYPDMLENQIKSRNYNLAKILNKRMSVLGIELLVINSILAVMFLYVVNLVFKKMSLYRKKLQEKEKFQIHLIESIPNPVYIVDRRGKILNVNKKFEEFFCVNEQDLISGKMENEYIEKIIKSAMDYLEGKTDNSCYELTVELCGQKKSCIEVYNSIYTDFDGNPAGVIGVIFDITVKKRREKRLKKESIIDPLTGLYNRRHFDEVVEDEVERSKRYKEPLSVIMYDIDYFKKVNDTYGHQTGDEILKKLSNLVKSNIRSSDYLFRVGGEEFVILLPGTDIERALKVAEKIRQTVENYNFEKPEHVTISLGVAQLKPNEDKDEFIKRADEALYGAKNKGRNRVERDGY